MSTIGQRVFVLGGNQLYMTLANEEFVRPLGIGSNWTKLRIGLLLAITPDGTNNIPGSAFAVGVCSGTANPLGAATTTAFGGVTAFGGQTFTAAGSADLLTYNAGGGNPYYSSGSAYSFTRIGSTPVNGGSGLGASSVVSTTGSTQRRTPFYYEITKVTPTTTTLGFYPPPFGVVGLDFSFFSFMSGMEQVGAPVISGVTWTTLQGNTMTISDNIGPLNTLDIYWKLSGFPIEIYAIAVYRMS